MLISRERIFDVSNITWLIGAGTDVCVLWGCCSRRRGLHGAVLLPHVVHPSHATLTPPAQALTFPLVHCQAEWTEKWRNNHPFPFFDYLLALGVSTEHYRHPKNVLMFFSHWAREHSENPQRMPWAVETGFYCTKTHPHLHIQHTKFSTLELKVKARDVSGPYSKELQKQHRAQRVRPWWHCQPSCTLTVGWFKSDWNFIAPFALQHFSSLGISFHTHPAGMLREFRYFFRKGVNILLLWVLFSSLSLFVSPVSPLQLSLGKVSPPSFQNGYEFHRLHYHTLLWNHFFLL